MHVFVCTCFLQSRRFYINSLLCDHGLDFKEMSKCENIVIVIIIIITIVVVIIIYIIIIIIIIIVTIIIIIIIITTTLIIIIIVVLRACRASPLRLPPSLVPPLQRAAVEVFTPLCTEI